jgi:hypothetical protein
MVPRAAGSLLKRIIIYILAAKGSGTGVLQGIYARVYLKRTILKKKIHAPRAAAREGRRGESTMINSGSKLKSGTLAPW